MGAPHGHVHKATANLCGAEDKTLLCGGGGGEEEKILKGPVWKKQSKDTDELLSMNEWPENPKTETIQGDTQNLKWCFCSQLAFPPAQYSSVQLKSQLLRSTRVASCITHQPAFPKSLSCIKRWTRKQHEGFSPFWLWRWKHAQPETTAAPHLATANVLQLLQAFSRYLPPNHQAVPLSHLLLSLFCRHVSAIISYNSLFTLVFLISFILQCFLMLSSW